MLSTKQVILAITRVKGMETKLWVEVKETFLFLCNFLTSFSSLHPFPPLLPLPVPPHLPRFSPWAVFLHYMNYQNTKPKQQNSIYLVQSLSSWKILSRANTFQRKSNYHWFHWRNLCPLFCQDNNKYHQDELNYINY